MNDPIRRPGNQRHWMIGGLLPRASREADHPADQSMMRTEMLACARPGGTPEADVTFRWLQIIERRIARESADGLEFVDAPAPGEGHIAWADAMAREVVLRVALADGAQQTERIDIRRGSATDSIERGGQRPGLVRSWRRLIGSVDVTVRELRPHIFRVRVEMRNETRWSGPDREDALRSSFHASHVVLHSRSAEFVSLTDPPASLKKEAAECDALGCRHVLIGPPGRLDTMLAAPGLDDLFDDGEIDPRLALKMYELTAEGMSTRRAADARVRDVPARTEWPGNAPKRRLRSASRNVP